MLSQGSVWWVYRWNGGSFVGTSTGAPVVASPGLNRLSDVDGDGRDDLLYIDYGSGNLPYGGSGVGGIAYRLNTSTSTSASFSSSLTAGFNVPIESSYYSYPLLTSMLGIEGDYTERFDYNGDGRADFLVMVAAPVWCNFYPNCLPEEWASEAFVMVSQPSGGWSRVPVWADGSTINWPIFKFARVNEDACSDLVIDGAVTLSSCKGAPAETLYPSGYFMATMDWDGDGRRDLMVMLSSSLYVSGTETTSYVGGLLEKVVVGSTTDWRHYISAEGQTVAIVSRKSTGSNTVSYPLEDHEGSSSVLTSSSGSSIVKESFNAFGLPRSGSTWSGAVPSGDKTLINGLTRRGYTFHSMLGDMGLIHMNGRVQDAITGRFLSPDPTIPNPGFTQSFNRYSYVNNNPMSFIDPSGFAEGELQPGECWDDRFGNLFVCPEFGVNGERIPCPIARTGCEYDPESFLAGLQPRPFYENTPAGGGGGGGGGSQVNLVTPQWKTWEGPHEPGLVSSLYGLDLVAGDISGGLLNAFGCSGDCTAAAQFAVAFLGVRIHPGRQGKHIESHNNFIPGRSPFTHGDPQGLLDRFGGTGQQIGPVKVGQPGSRERVNFGEVIGEVNGQPTTNGIIHYSSTGAHIVPAMP